jgi:hypothetical protein
MPPVRRSTSCRTTGTPFAAAIRIDSAKLDEMTESPEVNVTMQAATRFFHISGAARAARDREKVDELWKDAYDTWFSEGRDDPAVVLLEIVPTYVEYWDRSGMEGLKFMFSVARGAVTGDDTGTGGVHGKVDFPKTEDATLRARR